MYLHMRSRLFIIGDHSKGTFAQICPFLNLPPPCSFLFRLLISSWGRSFSSIPNHPNSLERSLSDTPKNVRFHQYPPPLTKNVHFQIPAPPLQHSFSSIPPPLAWRVRFHPFRTAPSPIPSMERKTKFREISMYLVSSNENKMALW